MGWHLCIYIHRNYQKDLDLDRIIQQPFAADGN